jgi:hypothetical protein
MNRRNLTGTKKQMGVLSGVLRMSLVAPAVVLSGLLVAPLPAHATGFGCDGAVCTEVIGGGLYVSDWNTTVANQSYRCSKANFWVNGQLTSTSSEICGSTKLRLNTRPERRYDNGTDLCNTWDGFDGKSCVRVWTTE